MAIKVLWKKYFFHIYTLLIENKPPQNQKVRLPLQKRTLVCLLVKTVKLRIVLWVHFFIPHSFISFLVTELIKKLNNFTKQQEKISE